MINADTINIDEIIDFKRAAFDLEVLLKQYVPVDTGALQEGISVSYANNALDVNIEEDYWFFVEHGTAYMAAQPFIGPAMDEIIAKIQGGEYDK